MVRKRCNRLQTNPWKITYGPPHLMKIFILGNAQRPGVTTQSEKLLPLLKKHFEVVLVDLEQKEDLSKHKEITKRHAYEKQQGA